MKEMRHRSPKIENNLFNNYYLKSQDRKDNNIINFNNIEIRHNNKEYNYYDEIKKAFNFITSILKQKDHQINILKIKIKELEQQLSDINETNIMTFNNQDISEIYPKEDKINYENKNNLKRFTYENNTKKLHIFNSKDLNKKKNNLYPQNNIINNNINIINPIKTSANINKINNYRKEITNNNYDYINNNINEYSNDKKKNINFIRKEQYNNKINIKYRNTNNNIKNYTNDTDTSIKNNKIKIYNINLPNKMNSKNSKSNSITLSNDSTISQSKVEIKNYLKEIKLKMSPDKFKKFISLIKTLVKNKNSIQKNEIIYEIKNMLIDKNLINKFENILNIK